MKKRSLKVISMLAAIMVAGIIYYIIIRIIPPIKCPIKRVTGLYCPGCGVTRMLVNLLDLEFYKAFRSNCAVFISLPFLVAFFGIRGYGYIKNGKPTYNLPMKIIVAVLTVGFLIFAILRNIPLFSFLSPL